MVCARFPVLLRASSSISSGRWIALGLVLSACEPVVVSVGILPMNDSGLGAPDPEDADGSPDDGDSSTARDGESPTAGEDAAAPRDCVDLIDLNLFMGDAGIRGPIAGETLKQEGCSPLDGGMWLEPTNSSVWHRKDGEPLLEANQNYAFFFTEALNVNKLRLTGGSDPCDTLKVHEELPFIPRIPTPACRTLRVAFDVYFLRHSGGEAIFLLNTINPPSYQLCKGGCQ